MIAAVVAVGLVVLVLGGGAAAVAAYFVYNSSETHATTPETPTVAVPTPEPPAPEGCKIVTHDARKDGKGTPTVVTLAGGTARDVTITGGIGFKAEWDGKGECDLGKLPEGRYRANITKADGDKIRGSSFEVVDGKKSCRFAFDVATRKWSGDCK